MLDFTGVNYWAVLVVVLVNMFVGGFWYSPFGFGKKWSKLTGVDMMKIPKKEANKALCVTALCAIIQGLLLALLVNSLHITKLVKGLELGLVLWAGFVASTTISDTMYGKRGWKLWQLNSGFYLVVLLINCAILAVWH